MKLKILRFDWDEGNSAKCRKHGLSVEEIEALFIHGRYRLFPDVKHSLEEKRFIAVGKGLNNRWIFIGFVTRNDLLRPITARYMHKKEIGEYEKEEDAPF
jgi:uncharacterized DUF497 family protein